MWSMCGFDVEVRTIIVEIDADARCIKGNREVLGKVIRKVREVTSCVIGRGDARIFERRPWADGKRKE